MKELRRMAKTVKSLKLPKTKKKFTTVMGMDMGVKNLAYSIIKEKKIVESTFFINTINNLLDPYYYMDLKKFIEELNLILDKHKPKAVIMERFQNRGRFFGNSTELINLMIGLISKECYDRKIYVYLATAATWKNQFNKINPGSEVLNKKGKKSTPLDNLYSKFKPYPNHLIDSQLQAFYLANLWNANQFQKWKPTQLIALSKKWKKKK